MILTLAEVKTNLGYSDNLKDNEISLLIKKAMDFIVKETNNYFIDFETSAIEDTAVFSSTNKTITFTEEITGWFNDIFIICSRKNSGFFKVKDISGNVITVEETLKDDTAEVIVKKVVFDDNLKYLASQMIKDSLEKEISSDVKSESAESYSVTFRDLDEFLNNYRKQLKPYKRISSL